MQGAKEAKGLKDMAKLEDAHSRVVDKHDHVMDKALLRWGSSDESLVLKLWVN